MSIIGRKSSTILQADKLVEYETHETMVNDEKLILRGVSAGMENKSFNLLLHQRYMRMGGGRNLLKTAQASIGIVKELFPVHIIRDWNAVDANGKPLPYTPENLRVLLDEWQDFRIEELMAFYQNNRNFYEEVPTEGDAVALGNASGDMSNGGQTTLTDFA